MGEERFFLPILAGVALVAVLVALHMHTSMFVPPPPTHGIVMTNSEVPLGTVSNPLPGDIIGLTPGSKPGTMTIDIVGRYNYTSVELDGKPANLTVCYNATITYNSTSESWVLLLPGNITGCTPAQVTGWVAGLKAYRAGQALLVEGSGTGQQTFTVVSNGTTGTSIPETNDIVTITDWHSMSMSWQSHGDVQESFTSTGNLTLTDPSTSTTNWDVLNMTLPFAQYKYPFAIAYKAKLSNPSGKEYFGVLPKGVKSTFNTPSSDVKIGYWSGTSWLSTGTYEAWDGAWHTFALVSYNGYTYFYVDGRQVAKEQNIPSGPYLLIVMGENNGAGTAEIGHLVIVNGAPTTNITDAERYAVQLLEQTYGQADYTVKYVYSGVRVEPATSGFMFNAKPGTLAVVTASDGHTYVATSGAYQLAVERAEIVPSTITVNVPLGFNITSTTRLLGTANNTAIFEWEPNMTVTVAGTYASGALSIYASRTTAGYKILVLKAGQPVRAYVWLQYNGAVVASGWTNSNGTAVFDVEPYNFTVTAAYPGRDGVVYLGTKQFSFPVNESAGNSTLPPAHYNTTSTREQAGKLALLAGPRLATILAVGVLVLAVGVAVVVRI